MPPHGRDGWAVLHIRRRGNLRDHFKKLAGLAALAMIVAVLAGPTAQAQNPQPANKFAASGSNEEVFGPGVDQEILSEQIKMPTNHELALSLSAECSIITAIKAEDENSGTGTDSAEGRIDVYITIDGRRVGVTTLTGDNGEITLCNRVHSIRLTDTESNTDGIDTLDEYQKSKMANGFNWFAINVGSAYDDQCVDGTASGCVGPTPANGNNILDVVVWARLAATPGADGCQLGDKACSEAIIGKRTLTAEPTHASVIEVVEEDGPGGT